jgi:hypothetical protein
MKQHDILGSGPLARGKEELHSLERSARLECNSIGDLILASEVHLLSLGLHCQ